MMYTKTLEYFQQLSTIPRLSKQEEKVREWLIEWAEGFGYSWKTDNQGNLSITVAGKGTHRDADRIILQAHMDMVGVKAADSNHNFETDPIQYAIVDDWMQAKGTTLGADNGIGLCMALAATHLSDHPPLELLFTVDEEQGMSGALNLDPGLLSGKKLINLDTEDLGEICISSAGGGRIAVEYTTPLSTQKTSLIAVHLSGLRGGHSGVDIDKKRGNANRWLFEILNSYPGTYALASIDGGTADNALCSFAQATLHIDDKEVFIDHATKTIQTLQEHYDEPSAQIDYKEVDDSYVCNETTDFVEAVCSLTEGIHTMSDTIPGLVQTSINTGIVTTTHTDGDGTIRLQYAPRSSDNNELDHLFHAVKKCFTEVGANVTVGSRYPGRKEDPSSSFIQEFAKAYEEALGEKPEIVAYHAGLECGAIVDTLGEGAQAVSFGPTILNPHSPDEKCYMPSVKICCNALAVFLNQ